ncbi:MAG: hypothetical protein WAZ34_03075 [Rhodocyclaceae bacterium]
MQFDLFKDNPDVGLRNAVVAALRARNPSALRDTIDCLRNDFPNDSHLDGFEHLYVECLALRQAEWSAVDIARQIERIEAQLLPVLKKVIGTDAAQRWIAPVYGELARAATGQAFSRSEANTHSASLFLQAGELAAARAAAEAIPSWRRIPKPLAWMAEITLRQDLPDEYWPLTAELAWIAPALLAPIFSRAAPSRVLHLYREFCAEAEDDGSEGDPATWFPAWLLVEHPDLLPFLRSAHPHNSRPAHSAALLIDLLIGERQGLSQTMVGKRGQLRELAPAIFARYMARR